MISVIVPTFNSADSLGDCLSMLVPAAIDSLVSEVIVVDGGSTDDTVAIADAMGARIIGAEGGRGAQLAEGARQAKSSWLLFLHSDTNLHAGWAEEAEAFMRQVARGRKPYAAAFCFALDDPAPAARRIEFFVRLRCLIFRLPYGDQGLLISRDFYDQLGGFRAMPRMEDVDIVRRIGRTRIVFLKTPATTRAGRYRQNAPFWRNLSNLALLGLYSLRVPTHILAKFYG